MDGRPMESLLGIVIDRGEFSLKALVDLTVRKQRGKEPWLAKQRAMKHQFQARNSCMLDGRNYRVARPLLLLARAQFWTATLVKGM